MSTLDITVRAEYTPNPNSLKFISSESFFSFNGSFTYNDKAEAEAVNNNMAAKLFDVVGVTKVFIMTNFVTVDKLDEINWKDIHIEIKQIIKDELESFRTWAEENKPEIPEFTGDDSDARAQIEAVLDKIRPALVADGGNIEFVDLVDKDARLRMVGACGTCPSAMMTMKMGVERALQAEVPHLVDTVTQVF